MIAPLEFIFGGDGEGGDDKENNHLLFQTGGTVNEIFSKKCEEIKNKYGVPIGYSCIITQNINYISKNNNIEDEQVREVDDDMFDTLFTLATINGENKTPGKVSTISKTKRSTIERPKKRRSTKKKSKNTKST